MFLFDFLWPTDINLHSKTPTEIDTFFQDIIMFAWMVEGNEPVDVIKADPTDNKYLASATEGEADFVISGDHHLLDLEYYQEIAIVNATEFISIWRKTEKANDQ